MSAIARILIVTATWALALQAHAQELTPGAIKELMTRIDAAIAHGDVPTLARHMAEHAVVSGTTTAGGQMQPFRMNKAQYLAALEAVWANATNYTYERSNEKITIDGDQATVTADVADSIVIQGRKLTSVSKERATIESIDGMLMVTQVVANTSTTY
jgi:ketosteroid isomerase-like protein